MPINQLRRNPITGQWTIILQDDIKIEDLIINKKKNVLHPQTGICPFCEQNEKLTPNEIMALRKEGFGANERGWRIRVIPDKNPVLQIYGDLNNRGVGVYDVLDGIGAHEIVIETPNHNQTIVDLNEDQITEIFWTFKERI